MSIADLKRLLLICYDKAHDSVTIRRCISSIFFEIVLFIAFNSPQYKDKIFRNQNGIYNGISEIQFLRELKPILYSKIKMGKNVVINDVDNFINFMEMLTFYRTLVDHFGGFRRELLNYRIYNINTFKGYIDVNSLPLLSREELIKILKQAENWLDFLEKLFS